MTWLDPENQPSQAVLDREIRKASTRLRRSDPVMAKLIRRHGICQLEATRQYFPLLVATVISQQLSTKAAQSIYRRLMANLGRKTPRPRDILAASDAQLTGAGLSRSKATFLRNVAETFSRRRLGPKTFARMSDQEVMETLTSIKGIGEWSAHMFLMFGLARLDVFPVGDLGLRNAMKSVYGLRRDTGEKRLRKIADAWRPYRTVGSLYLWKTYDGV